jgi:hypothetical protein
LQDVPAIHYAENLGFRLSLFALAETCDTIKPAAGIQIVGSIPVSDFRKSSFSG